MSRDRRFERLLDELIPPSPERGLPGAGELGLGRSLRASVPELDPVLEAALDFLGDDFPDAAPEIRRQRVEALSVEQPAAVPGVLFHLYRFYYAHPRVLEALGMPPRPPYPEGYEIGPNELSLLDAVRAREKLYRDA